MIKLDLVNQIPGPHLDLEVRRSARLGQGGQRRLADLLQLIGGGEAEVAASSGMAFWGHEQRSRGRQRSSWPLIGGRNKKKGWIGVNLSNPVDPEGEGGTPGPNYVKTTSIA